MTNVRERTIVKIDKETVAFTRRVRDACKWSGIQEDEPSKLAQKTGLSASLCDKYMNGKTELANIPGVNILAVARGLRVNALWLISGRGKPFYTLPENDEQHETVQIMKRLSDRGQQLVLGVARARAAEEKVSPPITDRFSATPR